LIFVQLRIARIERILIIVKHNEQTRTKTYHLLLMLSTGTSHPRGKSSDINKRWVRFQLAFFRLKNLSSNKTLSLLSREGESSWHSPPKRR